MDADLGKLERELPKVGTALPEVVFLDGNSVRLTVAVGDDDFSDLGGDRPRDTVRLRPLLLLPALPKHAVFAAQVTMFPRAGICTTLHQPVARATCTSSRLKTWASIHRRLGGENVGAVAPPLIDRGILGADGGLR
ncbi:hypothetical protein ACQ4PT_005200 [Festuca glaucescens]